MKSRLAVALRALSVRRGAKWVLRDITWRLKPGERLLDIGCGWGGLVQYAAAHYGVQAFGITPSASQAALALSRITTAGLFERRGQDPAAENPVR